MKKILWLLIWFPFMMWSQEEATPVSRGKIYLNAATTGNLMYVTSGISEFSGGELIYMVQAGGGYVFADNWVAGLDLILDKTRDYDSFASKWLFGPFTRYYFPYRRVLFFVHGGISYGWRNWELEYEEDPAMGTTQIHTLKYELMTGLAVPLGRTIHFDVMAGYDATSVRSGFTKSLTRNWGVKLGFSVFLDKAK